ncbi:hypothetical protein PG994_008017 [Apiospora phragmitis]|uniref:Uncharacterized protein n=1 Tax=Apiospora phragmitis TaxID=2905665 RepID=A0ABR1URU9_9PEZI
MNDTIRGDGLTTVIAEPVELANSSGRRGRARDHSGDSPPSYRRGPSGDTTQFPSLTPPTEEERRYKKRLLQLHLEYHAALPREQWYAESIEEAWRIVQASVDDGTDPPYLPSSINKPPQDKIELAFDVITRQWKARGIWDDEWEDAPPGLGCWKHEKPFEIKPASEPEEHLAMRMRDREASRPLHQFIDHVSAERDRSRG